MSEGDPSLGSLAQLPKEPVGGSVPTTPEVHCEDLQSKDEHEAGVSLPSAGSSKQPFVPRLDNLFNFQIVVFQVEGTLFQVLKNGFNVPGTIFEAMFTLPVADIDSDPTTLEGNSLENPIHLSGLCAKDFRAFLRVLYPFIGPTVVTTYEDWVGILKLSTMWDFKEIREKAISALSRLIKEKPVPERIMLGRTYRVPAWLRDEYVSLAQKTVLKLDELQGSGPSAITLDWETIAKIMSVREHNTLANLRNGRYSSQVTCYQCHTIYGWAMELSDCRCRLPAVVDTVFQAEFEAMKQTEVPLPNLPQNLADDPDLATGKKSKKKKK